MKEDILYFTQDRESSCSRAVRKREGIKMLDALEPFADYVAGVKAAIVDVEGDERQQLLKALLKEKIPFALCGLSGETPDSLKRLCAAAKRRHIQICWLGSWRFHWSMARMKELAGSGALGTLQTLLIRKPEEEGVFERLRDDDLMTWLDCNNEASFSYEPSAEECFRLVVTGTRGTANAVVRPDGTEEFAVALEGGRPRTIVQQRSSWEAEIGYLAYAIHTGRPWSMLGRIPN